jgi:hypothetical protein
LLRAKRTKQRRTLQERKSAKKNLEIASSLNSTKRWLSSRNCTACVHAKREIMSLATILQSTRDSGNLGRHRRRMSQHRTSVVMTSRYTKWILMMSLTTSINQKNQSMPRSRRRKRLSRKRLKTLVAWKVHAHLSGSQTNHRTILGV